MTDATLPPPVATAHLQAEFLVELLLQGEHDRVRDLILDMPDEEFMPLLGAALIYATEAMRDHWGTKGALKVLAKARKATNEKAVRHG